jgi:hypothetical protein
VSGRRQDWPTLSARLVERGAECGQLHSTLLASKHFISNLQFPLSFHLFCITSLHSLDCALASISKLCCQLFALIFASQLVARSIHLRIIALISVRAYGSSSLSPYLSDHLPSVHHRSTGSAFLHRHGSKPIVEHIFSPQCHLPDLS